MQLTSEMWDGMRQTVQAKNDADIATMFRERNEAEVSHLSDDELMAEIRTAREQAVEIGIKSPRLRMWFIMLGVLRLPRFWENPTIAATLSSKTGTADIRFGDVYTLFERAADRSGNNNYVWW